uniref:Caspase domain-containing protein n=1 Tax=Candidatus Kentrum sp. TUN TaxID=2126343 RepID=A0A450ZH54_9GAMM|nr:MAG: Caspase domain-containing protein [Candidatus Kentron sp. TUN]VFK53980.1 MAG: Caspase domain-containing protein [Candidatus Kentron sp. TUN]VFK56081.1 MAG: Caspase domain-containing protein [Candidatus Kentron sp. TUN]
MFRYIAVISITLAFLGCQTDPYKALSNIQTISHKTLPGIDAASMTAYPRVSPTADQLLLLHSNQQKTTFYIDGKKMAVGRRVKVLIDPTRAYTIKAKPEGYIAKEEYIQPPYIASSPLSFIFMLGERIKETATIKSRSSYQPSVASTGSHYDVLSTSQVHIPKNLSDTLDYHAMVIGIDNYHHLPKLKTAISDAKQVAKIFRDIYRYEVRLLIDASRSDIIETLSGYRRTLDQTDAFVIYFAGHGWLDDEADQGYWLPANASEDNEIHWISNDYVTSTLKAIQARHVLVISDSCYSGKLTRGVNIKRRSPDYLSKMIAKRARVVLTSGGIEPVSDSGKNGHSVFAGALLAALRENNGVMDGTMLFSKLRRPVMVNSDQTPEYGDIRKAGHEGGDFLFIRR